MSRWHLVQTGRAPVVVIYLCGADAAMDAALRTALPGAAIVTTADSGVAATPDDLHEAQRVAGVIGPIVLCGYSAGCQGVRAHLWHGVDPAGVVVIDGTAGAWPAPRQDQIEVWAQAAARARRRERLLVATCTAQRYTQRLNAAQGGPFAATSTILARALGVPDLASYPAAAHSLESYPGEPVIEQHDGQLHVYGYPGTDCDIHAHAAQLRVVLPVLLARHVAPLYEAHDTDPSPPPSGILSTLTGPFVSAGAAAGRLLASLLEDGAGPLEGGTLGERCNAFCRSMLGVEEIPGPRHEPRIVALGRYCRRGGIFLGVDSLHEPKWSGTAALVGAPTDEEAWCAKLQSEALRVSLRDGEAAPHGLRVSVAELVADARRMGSYHEASSSYEPHVGDLAIYARSGQDPRTGGQGHVAAVTIVPTHLGTYETIGGNEAPGWGQVRLTPRKRGTEVAWVARG